MKNTVISLFVMLINNILNYAKNQTCISIYAYNRRSQGMRRELCGQGGAKVRNRVSP